MRYKICIVEVVASLLVFMVLFIDCVSAQTIGFTQAERQQINIATVGLFSKSKSFSVDFSEIKASEWSFPLPVGKATADATGINISTSEGDAVKVMFSGKVRLSRHHAGYGNFIVVRHENGLETVYGNNAQNLVKVGDHVKAGQTIAIVGRKTDTEAPTLRFEIMVNGCLINPLTLIQVRSHKLQKGVFLFTNNGSTVKVSKIATDGTIEEASTKDLPHDAPIDMDAELTSADQNIVSAKTPGLFGKSGSITINFANFAEADWCYPLQGSKVISPYGGKRRHSGVDIKTKPNDNVYAAFEGKVRFSKSYAGYGNVIVIRHASGIETVYSHNSKNLVKSGDWVKAGQLIAFTGRTGRATTEHVHFEIRINGRHYNPELIFDNASRKLKPVKLIAYSNGKVVTKNQ